MTNHLNLSGLLLGIIAFLSIGLSHPLVIKTEYYFGKKIWWIYLNLGIILSIISLLAENITTSIILGTLGFSFFWSTLEIFKQHQRVLLGRAKQNPNRLYSIGVFPYLSLLGLPLNFSGFIVGVATFAIIFISRYICIKGEYYFTKRFWIAFLMIGVISILASLFIKNTIFSAILSINGFTFLWGIGEIIEQEERVKKGWFPKNPKRS